MDNSINTDKEFNGIMTGWFMNKPKVCFNCGLSIMSGNECGGCGIEYNELYDYHYGLGY